MRSSSSPCLRVSCSDDDGCSASPESSPERCGCLEASSTGLKPRWTSGYGRWVGNVLVWTKGPLLFRTQVVQIDRLFGERRPDELKWLGDAPVAVEFECGAVRVEVAAKAEDRALVVDGFGKNA